MAVIGNDEKSVGTIPSRQAAGSRRPSEVVPPPRQTIEVRAVVTIRKKMKEKINERAAEHWDSFIHGIGRGILIQLVSEEVDPGKLCFPSTLLFFSICSRHLVEPPHRRCNRACSRVSASPGLGDYVLSKKSRIRLSNRIS